MKENGRRCDLHIYEGKKHGWYNLWVSRDDMAESLIRMDRFLTSLGYLDGEPVIVTSKHLPLEGKRPKHQTKKVISQ